MMKSISFRMDAVAPFRLDYTAWALRRRPENIIDTFEGGIYRRALVFEGSPVLVSVIQPEMEKPEIEIRAMWDKGEYHRARLEEFIKGILIRMLGMKKDLRSFYVFSKKEAHLKLIVQRFMGLKPPMFPSVFECAVNAIACQQLSLNVGMILLSHVAKKFGKRIKTPEGKYHAFPEASALRKRQAEDFRGLGFSFNKAIAIIALSKSVTEGRLDLERLLDLDNESAVKELLEIRGIGRWSAEYILLRGLGRTGSLPADDIGFRNKLTDWLNIGEKLDYEGVLREIKRFGPYAGLIYFHLLLKSLLEKGYIQ